MTAGAAPGWLIVLTGCLLVALPTGCGPGNPAHDAGPGHAANDTDDDVRDAGSANDVAPAPVPADFATLYRPWLGDLPGMTKRRMVRVAVPLSDPLFFYENGRPRGILMDFVREFEKDLNRDNKARHLPVIAVPIPMSRRRMIPDLIAGRVDLIAADLTVTVGRRAFVEFTEPLLRDVREVLVTGPGAEPIGTLTDLSGRTVFVRQSSSYFEHLTALNATFTAYGLAPIVIETTHELLEADDLIEMLAAELIPMTVVDDYRARWFAQAYPEVVVREDIAVNDGGDLAWAVRKDAPKLAARVNAFLKRKRQGTLFGNVVLEKYLVARTPLGRATSEGDLQTLAGLARTFREFADVYDHDWLKLAAQAYQESGLRHDRESPAGAVGIMQIRPSTAADPNVGIPDITTVENNIHAGARYMRFLEDRYFSGDDFDELNRWLFTLAAYNAGPARVRRLREEAADAGYDPNVWFQNVEVIAARRIGRETVSYVSNIFRYYLGYRIAIDRDRVRQELLADGGCDDAVTGCRQQAI